MATLVRCLALPKPVSGSKLRAQSSSKQTSKEHRNLLGINNNFRNISLGFGVTFPTFTFIEQTAHALELKELPIKHVPFVGDAFLHNNTPLLQTIPYAIIADLDPATASLLASLLGPVISALNFLFILRIVMSWYPQLPVTKLPYSIAFIPTEPILAPTRKIIEPIGGVDVSPVIWVAIMSFINEILLGSQGLLVLLSSKDL